MNPPVIINQSKLNFTDSNDDERRNSVDQIDDDGSSNDEIVRDEVDDFLTGVPGGRRKKRKTRDPNEALTKLLEVYGQKWEADKVAEAATRLEEQKSREMIVDLVRQGHATMDAAVEVLKVIVPKM